MRAPVLYRDNQWDELFEPLLQHMRVYDDTGKVIGIRKNVNYASMFMVFGTSGDALVHPEQIPIAERFLVPYTPTVHDAVHLFWNMFQPQLIAIPSVEDTQDLSVERLHLVMNPPASAPSVELNTLLRDCLDWMYRKHRVPSYQPDVDDSENLIDLVVELHISAARAFKLKQLEPNNMSEEWVSRLRSVESTVRRINTIASPYWHPSFAVSTDAIWGMTQLELSRISRKDGSYADAVEYLGQAAYSYAEAFGQLGDFRTAEALLGIDVFGNAGPADKHGGSPWTSSLDWDEETVKNAELSAQREIKSRFTPLQVSLEEAACLFNLLKQSKTTDDVNWREIAEDCEGLAVLPLMDRDVFTGVKDFVENEEGNLSLSWSEFWYGAGAWATAQLSPSEYRKMREDDEKHAAETRLKNYFFESGWVSLSERARERLISADRDWNSRERVSKEAILRHLLRATEQMCFDFIWRPLEDSVAQGNNLPGFTNRMSELAKKRRSPSVHDYSWACQSVFCGQSLAQDTLSSSEIKFIKSRLPEAMKRLNSASGPADHEPEGYESERSFSNDDLRSFFREFLGIGLPDILPELARIGRKLQRSSL